MYLSHCWVVFSHMLHSQSIQELKKQYWVSLGHCISKPNIFVWLWYFCISNPIFLYDYGIFVSQTWYFCMIVIYPKLFLYGSGRKVHIFSPFKTAPFCFHSKQTHLSSSHRVEFLFRFPFWTYFLYSQSKFPKLTCTCNSRQNFQSLPQNVQVLYGGLLCAQMLPYSENDKHVGNKHFLLLAQYVPLLSAFFNLISPCMVLDLSWVPSLF